MFCCTKTTLLFFVYSFILFTNVQSQSNHWIKQHPPLTGSELKDVYFVNENKGWIVGQNGVVMYTSDQGATWQFQNTPVQSPPRLYSVTFIDSLNGWAAGGVLGYSYIIKTSDGGKNWVEANMPNPEAYVYDIHFVNENKGFILTAKRENHLYVTTNSGETWEERTISDTHLSDIFFLNDSVGVISGDMGFIAKTTDGGENWVRSQISTTSSVINKVVMVNETIGYAISMSGSIYKTSDSAESWQIIFENPVGRFQLNALHTFNEDTIVVVGGYSPNAVLKTTDGGTTWNYINTEINPQITNWYFINKNLGFGVTWNGAIIKITNEGETYREVTENTGNHLTAMDFCNSSFGLAGDQDAKLIFTADGGLSWNEMKSPVSNMINCITVSSNQCYLIGGIDTIATTIDGGVTWNYHYSQEAVFKSGKIPDTEILYYLTSQNSLWIQNSREDEWTQKSKINFNGNVTNIYFLTSDMVFACGPQGTLLKSLDRGENWAIISNPEINFCESIYFKDEYTGWLGSGEEQNFGVKPLFYKTTDGGVTWQRQDNIIYQPDFSYPSDVSRECNGRIKEIRSFDGINIFALSNRYVFFSNDGGETWKQQSMDLYGGNYLTTIKITDNGNMWIGGNSGFIWKYNSNVFSITEIEDEEENNSFINCYAYPNPFNSNVNIVFNLSAGKFSEKASLIIYNITGEKIFYDVINVREGENRYRWIPENNLVSGIYFVKLSAGEHTFINKLLYLK